MTKVTLYDIEANKIEAIAAETDNTPAEVVEAIFEALKDNGIKIEDYLPLTVNINN